MIARPLPERYCLEMNRVSRALTLSMGLLWTGVAAGAEKKILFLAGRDSHGWGTHQHFGGTVILSNGMKHAGLPVEVQVVREWPGAAVLKDQDALVIYADGWGAHPANGHLDELKEFMDGGGGLTVPLRHGNGDDRIHGVVHGFRILLGDHTFQCGDRF